MGASYRAGRHRFVFAVLIVVIVPSVWEQAPAAESNRIPTGVVESLAGSLPAGTVRVEDRGVGEHRQRHIEGASRSPADYIRAAQPTHGGAMGAANLVALEKGLLEGAWHRKVIQVGDHASTAADPGRTQSTSNNTASPRAEYFWPIGDLDRDGLTDLLGGVYSYNADTDERGLALSGTRGTDGAALWTVDLTGADDWFVVPVDDVTGGPAEDILVVDLRGDGFEAQQGCQLVVCTSSQRWSYHWTVRLVSGDTGAKVWARTFAGQGDWGEFATGGSYYSATNVGVNVLPAGDLNGDGRPDFATNAYSISDGGVATRSEITSGADGSAMLERSDGTSPTGGGLYPVGNAVGDATPDILWEHSFHIAGSHPCGSPCVDLNRFAVEMIDGSDFATAWTSNDVRLDGAEVWVASALADLTGDGRHDLFEFIVDPQRWGRVVSVRAVSGVDGKRVWERPGSEGNIGFEVVGPIGGGPGRDVLEIGGDYTGAEDRIVTTRIDGATGTVLFTTSRDAPVSARPWGSDLYFIPVGDVDGDAVVDQGFIALSYDRAGSVDSWRSLVESGKTGTVLFEPTTPEVFVPAGDVNADGKDDLLSFGPYAWSPGMYSYTLTLLAMPSGAPLWSMPLRSREGGHLILRPAGDMTGGGGADLVMFRAQRTSERIEVRTDVVDGRNGVSTWGVGDLTFPEPQPFGSISGTVRVSGSPPDYECVEIYQASGAFVRHGNTQTDGRYTIELAVGTYKVRFIACGSRNSKSFWYPHADTIEEAQTIEVFDGTDTAGIDGTFEPIPPPMLLRRETQQYVAAGGDVVIVHPAGCGQTEPPTTGGACFVLNGAERQVNVAINDEYTTGAIAGFMAFEDASDVVITSRAFCGSISGVEVPYGSVKMNVWTFQGRGPLLCDSSAIATTGSVTAEFYD